MPPFILLVVHKGDFLFEIRKSLSGIDRHINIHIKRSVHPYTTKDNKITINVEINMTRFLTALTLAIFCLEFASCELTLENVYAEVLSLRTVVKTMEKKLLVQEVQMGELNKIISEQRDLLDQARAENRESSWEVPHTEEGTKTKEFLRGQQEGVSVSDVISNNTSSYFTHHPQNKEPMNEGHRVHRGIDGFLRQGLHD